MQEYALLPLIQQYDPVTYIAMQNLQVQHSNKQDHRVLPSTRQYYQVQVSTIHYYSVLHPNTA